MNRLGSIVALVVAGWVLAAGPAAGGLMDSLKDKAAEEAKKQAMKAASQKLKEMTGKDRPADVPADELTDAFVGEYVGEFRPAEGQAVTAVAKVFRDRAMSEEGGKSAKGEKGGTYRAVLTAVESGLVEKAVLDKDAKVVAKAELSGPADGPRLVLKGNGWVGSVYNGNLSAEGAGGKFVNLKAVVRTSPTELAAPPAGAVVLLPFEVGKKPSLGEWLNTKWKPLSDGSVLVGAGDNSTKRQFGRFKLHVEFLIPVDPLVEGNSGIYILDRYELQVLDSFGRTAQKHDCASVYQTFPPQANACLPAGRWQTFDIEFAGPTMEGDKAVKLPVITVEHNGVTVHKDVEVPGATGQAKPKGHAATGPIRLQSHGCPVRFRNIWLVETKAQ